MVAPLLALAAAAEDADPLEPRLPHRHGYYAANLPLLPLSSSLLGLPRSGYTGP